MEKDDLQSGIRTIDYVVHSIQNSLDDMGTTNYRRYLQFAIDAYHELNLYVLPQSKTVFLDVDANGSAPFPSDYLYYYAIGVCMDNQIWNLTLDPSMCKEGTPSPDINDVANGSANADIYLFQYYYGGVFRNGQFVGELYGCGGGYNKHGYYNIDKKNRRIEFSSIVPGKPIVMSYKASGVDCNGGVIIPLEAVAPIREYVLWRMIENNSQVPSSEKERKRRLYYIAYDRLQFFINSVTKDEFLDSKYRTLKQTPKR